MSLPCLAMAPGCRAGTVPSVSRKATRLVAAPARNPGLLSGSLFQWLVFFLLGFRRGAHVVCLEIAGHGHFKADGKFCPRGAQRLFVVCACPSSGFAWCCPLFSSSAWLSGSVQELVPVRTHNRAAGCFLPCPFFYPGPGCSREPLDLLFSVKGVDTASI